MPKKKDMAGLLDEGDALIAQGEVYADPQPLHHYDYGHWPIDGLIENQAIAGVLNARTYWDQGGCGRLFGQVNTLWYTLQDIFPTTPSASFGIVGNPLSDMTVYDLSCSGVSTPARDVPSASVTAAIEITTAASAQAGNVGTGQKIGSGSGSFLHI